MNLHEYQSKALFAKQGIPIPKGGMICTVSEARSTAEKVSTKAWVIKAQVHAGGRGKAGGVVIVHTLDEVEAEAKRLLGSTLTTHQSNGQGLPINQLLIESPTDIKTELYLSVLIDRTLQQVIFIASAAGGMNIEEVAEKTPEKITQVAIHPATGIQGYHIRALAFAFGLVGQQIKQMADLMRHLYTLFTQIDASLIEINPLVINQAGDLIALDGKINLDGSALYRHKDLAILRDVNQEDEREAAAREHDLNYISLQGNIGCMVNGAGLAMATMDLVKLQGGQPANFLDVGGGTTAKRVTAAFKLILSDPNVKAVLVNIFGGIVRCDLIAEGIIEAYQQVEIDIPLVIRLEGTNAPQGLEKLQQSGLKLHSIADLTTAAKKVVELAGDKA